MLLKSATGKPARRTCVCSSAERPENGQGFTGWSVCFISFGARIHDESTSTSWGKKLEGTAEDLKCPHRGKSTNKNKICCTNQLLKWSRKTHQDCLDLRRDLLKAGQTRRVNRAWEPGEVEQPIEMSSWLPNYQPTCSKKWIYVLMTIFKKWIFVFFVQPWRFWAVLIRNPTATTLLQWMVFWFTAQDFFLWFSSWVDTQKFFVESSCASWINPGAGTERRWKKTVPPAGKKKRQEVQQQKTLLAFHPVSNRTTQREEVPSCICHLQQCLSLCFRLVSQMGQVVVATSYIFHPPCENNIALRLCFCPKCFLLNDCPLLPNHLCQNGRHRPKEELTTEAPGHHNTSVCQTHDLVFPKNQGGHRPP